MDPQSPAVIRLAIRCRKGISRLQVGQWGAAALREAQEGAEHVWTRLVLLTAFYQGLADRDPL